MISESNETNYCIECGLPARGLCGSCAKRLALDSKSIDTARYILSVLRGEDPEAVTQ